jgi:protein-tyrosine phosphatase
MARVAYQDGVAAVVVTPHESAWLERHPGADAGAVLRAQVRALEEDVHGAGIPLVLHPGMEVELDLELPERLQAGRAIPLGGGPYILLELPAYQRTLYLDQVIFQLQLQGWRPILAHAERYRYIHEAPDMLVPLVQRGLLVQITARNLAGAAGRQVQSTAQRLLRRGLVHLLASDGHSAVGPRVPVLTPGVEAAARIVGPARARAMVTEVPERILDGEATDMLFEPGPWT